MQVAILGPLQVVRDGVDVVIAGARLRSLLARLALDAGRAVPSGVLVDALWRDELPADEANALQSLVSRLRRALGEPALIQQAPGGYRLALEPDDVDAHRFERLARDGRVALASGDAAAARDRLADALGLWRGSALADVRDAPFADAPAVRLDELRLAATEDCADADLALGRHADVVGRCESMLREHPLRERVAGQLMTALAGVGRQADALAVYERTRRRLADELGVDPSPGLQAAHLAVLRGDHRPPAPPENGRHTTLRAQLTSFVGREEEVERIGKLFETSRLVEIIGPGGAGKTRLGVQIAERMTDRLPELDRVWMVELAAITDPAAVAQTVLAALGLRDATILDRPPRSRTGARDAQTRLVDSLADEPAVILMDNCEHLLGAVAQLVDHLLARCPLLRVLATSREPLGIVGETLCVIPPLEHPVGPDALTPDEALAYPAVRLFADRASAARRGFTVDDDTVGKVVEICRRLDGLPLAIELAAARLRSLSIEQIAARLDDRFRLLSGGSRAALPRHRTLRAVVDWSWDLLTESERRLAERVAVFPAGVTPQAAEAVCAGDGVGSDDIVDLLAALVDKSLLQLHNDYEPRYRMLETIREFGIERLAERGELAAVRQAHARYFAALVTEADPHLRAAEQLEWMARVNADKGNLLAALRCLAEIDDADAALRMASDVMWWWMLQGAHEESVTWLELALSARGGGSSLRRAIVRSLHAVNLAVTTGRFDEAAITIAETKPAILAGDASAITLLPMLQVLVSMLDEDFDGAERVIERNLPNADPWVDAALHLMRAGLAENSGHIDEQMTDLVPALRGFRALGDRWGMATALSELASARRFDADLVGAIEAYEESIQYAEELGSRGDVAETLLKMVDIRMRQGDLDRAHAELARVQEMMDTNPGDTPGFVKIFVDLTLGWLTAMSGDVAQGRRLLAAALERSRSMMVGGPKQLGVMALTSNAEMELLAGDAAAAGRLLLEAYPLVLETQDMPVTAEFGRALAGYLLRVGRSDDAAQTLGASDGLRGRADPTHPRSAELLAELREKLGEDGFAVAYERGKALDRDAAVATLNPTAVG